jgi:hypothetical protein
MGSDAPSLNGGKWQLSGSDKWHFANMLLHCGANIPSLSSIASELLRETPQIRLSDPPITGSLDDSESFSRLAHHIIL